MSKAKKLHTRRRRRQANNDCKPRHALQTGRTGSVFSRHLRSGVKKVAGWCNVWQYVAGHGFVKSEEPIDIDPKEQP